MRKVFLIILFYFYLPLCAYGHESITQIINVDADPNVSVTVKSGTVTSTTIGTEIGSLLSVLDPGFTVVSNSVNFFQLYSTIIDSNGTEIPGMFTSGGIRYMLLGNNNSLKRPTSDAITNAKSSSPSALLNPNVIAYEMSPNIDNTGVATFTTDHYDLVLKRNTTNLYLNIGTAARSQTFSTHDYCGDYQTTLYIDLLP